MANRNNKTNKTKQDEQDEQDIIDFEFPDIPPNPYVPEGVNFQNTLTELEKTYGICDQNKHIKCTEIFNKLRYLLENCEDTRNLYYYNYYRNNGPDAIINNIINNLISTSCLFHNYKYKLYIIKLLITKYYKFTNITIMPILISVSDFFNIYIHCVKTNMSKQNKEEFIIELNKVFKYLKIIIELSDPNNKSKLDEINKNKVLNNDYHYNYRRARRVNPQTNTYDTIYDLPTHMDKELFKKNYENLKSLFEYFDTVKNNNEIDKYIEYGIINDFQELINHIIDNKIELKNYYLILSLAFGNVELAKTFILHGCKISKNTLNEVLRLLLTDNIYNSIIKKHNEIKFEPFQFMIENSCEYDKVLVMKFFEKYIGASNTKYVTNIVVCTPEIASQIANCIFTTKNCLTLDELIKFTEKHIILNSPIKLGLDINSDKFREFCTKLEYNPYKVKEKLSMEQLYEACKGTNIAKVKKICKIIKPDIQCLRNACLNKLNKKTVQYLVETQGLQFDEECLANALYSCHTTLNSYIYNKYKQQNLNKIENKIPTDYNSLSENEDNEENKLEENKLEENKLEENKLEENKLEENKLEENIKNDKQCITETADGNNLTNLNTEDINNTNKVKKIIRKHIIKVKADSTKSDNLNQEILVTTETKDTNQITNKTKVIKKKIVKVKKQDEEIEEIKENIKDEIKFKILPSNYNFRKVNKIKENIKNILKLNKCEISFNDLREEILNYLNINKLFNGNKINIKDFKLSIIEIDFNELDDFIYNLYE